MYKFFKIFKLVLICVLYFNNYAISFEEKIKIGLLVPLTGNDKKIGQQIIKSTKIALKDIDSEKIEIHPKDTKSDPFNATAMRTSMGKSPPSTHGLVHSTAD